MARIIKEITPRNIRASGLHTKHVAAYARVSSGKEAMLHSLSAQVSSFSSMIQKTPGWEYAGVYADEACTGTKDNRAEFQRLLSDCRAGKIDLIITKAISRFARNTLSTLQTIRELRSLNVDVYFMEQNIHTIGGDGELLLTILAAYAQEEARSVSENQKWRIKANYEQGLPWSISMFGYRLVNGKLEIVPEEARLSALPPICILRESEATISPRLCGRPEYAAGAAGRLPAVIFQCYFLMRNSSEICCFKNTISMMELIDPVQQH